MRELRPWIERRLAELERTRGGSPPAARRSPTSGDAAARSPSPGARGCTAAGTTCSSPPADAPPGARALVPPPRAGRDRAAAGRGDRARRHGVRGADDPRAAHALGELLGARRDELQLAAAAGARAGARLRRLARGLPPRGPGPLPALLALLERALPGLPRARGLAAPPRRDAGAVSAAPPRASRSSATSSGWSSRVVDRVPAAGEIVARARRFGAPAGGGAVAAVQLRARRRGAVLHRARRRRARRARARRAARGARRSTARGAARRCRSGARSPTSTRRRAHDHGARRAARPARRRPAAVGAARRRRRRVLHRRRRRGARRRRRGARPGRDAAGARGLRAPASSSTCSSPARTTPGEASARASARRRGSSS